MKKTGIFYGSTTGTTKEIAYKIGKLLNIDEKDIHNVANSKPSDVDPYEVLILGSSTWGKGQLQKDWYDFMDGLEALYLKGKKVAIFGCGDETMGDTFD
ncbi:MAG: flavodoxin domain-containing protein, partial [Muribaculaceae bacterium]|nr:flavodoxin domain-containing protein [Muribaculaceae bacterium]